MLSRCIYATCLCDSGVCLSHPCPTQMLLPLTDNFPPQLIPSPSWEQVGMHTHFRHDIWVAAYMHLCTHSGYRCCSVGIYCCFHHNAAFVGAHPSVGGGVRAVRQRPLHQMSQASPAHDLQTYTCSSVVLGGLGDTERVLWGGNGLQGASGVFDRVPGVSGGPSVALKWSTRKAQRPGTPRLLWWLRLCTAGVRDPRTL